MIEASAATPGPRAYVSGIHSGRRKLATTGHQGVSRLRLIPGTSTRSCRSNRPRTVHVEATLACGRVDRVSGDSRAAGDGRKARRPSWWARRDSNPHAAHAAPAPKAGASAIPPLARGQCARGRARDQAVGGGGGGPASSLVGSPGSCVRPRNRSSCAVRPCWSGCSSQSTASLEPRRMSNPVSE